MFREAGGVEDDPQQSNRSCDRGEIAGRRARNEISETRLVKRLLQTGDGEDDIEGGDSGQGIDRKVWDSLFGGDDTVECRELECGNGLGVFENLPARQLDLPNRVSVEMSTKLMTHRNSALLISK